MKVFVSPIWLGHPVSYQVWLLKSPEQGCMEEAVDCDCDDKTNNGEAHDDVVKPFKLV